MTEDWLPLGDAALRVARPPGVGPRALVASLRACDGVVDVVVTQAHACVHFDPRAPPQGLDEALARASAGDAGAAAREIVLPVRYDGPDLTEVAGHAGLSPDETADLHAAGSYEVLLLGFMPGFAYLGGLDPRLLLPRRRDPRARVPARSVAVAGEYTAVYPFASPGGWSLIGSTDLALFDADIGALLRLGDRVRFERVA